MTFFPELPNTVESADQDRVRGHVLSNGIDANGRVIGFVEPGDAAEPDGAQVFLDEPRARRTVNAALLADGLVYAALYSTLPASLRAEFAQTARAARAAGAGLWPRATADPDGPAQIADRAALETLVLWPKLFRRLVPYLAEGADGFDGFDALAARRPRQPRRPDRPRRPHRAEPPARRRRGRGRPCAADRVAGGLRDHAGPAGRR